MFGPNYYSQTVHREGPINTTERFFNYVCFSAVYTEPIMIEDISPSASQTSTDSPGTEIHRFSHDRPMDQSLSVSIIHAVATVADVDPLSLQPRLYDVIDSDALETLVTSTATQSDIRVTFMFGAYEVTVTQAGEIMIQKNTDIPSSD